VGGDVPVRAARGGVGTAPLARPEAGLLGGCGRRVEPHVPPGRGACGAGRAAVDAGAGDSGVEHAVEPAVLAADRAVAGIRIEAPGRRGGRHVHHCGPGPGPILAEIGRGRPEGQGWWRGSGPGDCCCVPRAARRIRMTTVVITAPTISTVT